MALLVEALAQAGMLPCDDFPSDCQYREATVLRASTWAEAAAQAARCSPRIAVATGSVPRLVLRDSAGEPVRIVQAEALFTRYRQAPPARTGFQRVLGAVAYPGPLTLPWFRKLFCHIQPSLLSKPERHEI